MLLHFCKEGVLHTHILLKLLVQILDISTYNVKPSSNHTTLLGSMIMFAIDEASTMPIHALHGIGRLIKDITSVNIPFGENIILLGVVIFIKC